MNIMHINHMSVIAFFVATPPKKKAMTTSYDHLLLLKHKKENDTAVAFFSTIVAQNKTGWGTRECIVQHMHHQNKRKNQKLSLPFASMK
jgi:hypothetical protein